MNPVSREQAADAGVDVSEAPHDNGNGPTFAHQIGGDHKAQRWSLLAELERLGGELDEGALPSPNSLRQVVAGLVHYLATGGLDAPAAPDASAAQVSDPRDAELAAARQRIAELEAADVEQPAPAAEPGSVPDLEGGS